MKTKYYNLKKILSTESHYNIIIGQRSNGKTYACLNYGLEQYLKTGKQFAIIRRYREDLRLKRADTMFNALISNGVISKLTNGEYTSVTYASSAWYLSKYDESLDKMVRCETPFAYAFALTEMEHDKSSSYPLVGTIIFDEFLTRGQYLSDEFTSFMNVLSTIIRDRTDVKIFMLGNTVNMYCPYFADMGLNNIKNQKQGTIDVYTYGDSELKVAVEYCSNNTITSKTNETYFAFNNPHLNMIKNGVWEMDIYPHCPVKFTRQDIIFLYFIVFDGYTLQCEVVNTSHDLFTFIHQKTTPLRDEETDLIYSFDFSSKLNHRRNLLLPSTPIEKRLVSFFHMGKVFYQNNTIGECVRNYLNACKCDRI